MKTLFITKDFPYPINGGVSLRNQQNISIMQKYGEVDIFSVSEWPVKHSAPPEINHWIHCNIQKLRTKEEGNQQKLWWFYSTRYPNADAVYCSSAGTQLMRYMEEFKPDIVVLEELWVSRYIPILKSFPCKIILDQHNIEYPLFQQRQTINTKLHQKITFPIRSNHIKSLEKIAIKAVDQIWVCSENEQQLIKNIYGQTPPIIVIPNGVNMDYYTPVYQKEIPPISTFSNHPHIILFLGLLAYLPNKEAVQLLFDRIYPQIKQKYPDTQLLIVGRNPQKEMLEKAQKDPQITIIGNVPDVLPYLATATVMAVPLQKGGGTRFKLLEAFASGCPVVSTTKGAEGITIISGENIIIADTVEETVKAIDTLFSSPELVSKIRHSAFELVNNHYSWTAITKNVGEALQQL